MDDNKEAIARTCLARAESNTASSTQMTKMLIGAGFEGYITDLRRGVVTYYLPSGESVQVNSSKKPALVDASFNVGLLQEAILWAGNPGHDYTYKGFCDRIADAGCAGYIVSYPGKRIVFFGRTAETHAEDFPIPS